MMLYAVVWTAFSCPGGWFGGFIPKRLQPAVCDEVRTFKLYDPARLEEAKERVRKLGYGAELQECRGDDCRPISKWLVKFEGEQ